MACVFGKAEYSPLLAEMDPGLHVKQAVNHINRILAYAPFVRDADNAVVALTPEDWQVVADAMFRMSTPKEVFPDAILDFRLSPDQQTIELDTADGPIVVEMS